MTLKRELELKATDSKQGNDTSLKGEECAHLPMCLSSGGECFVRGHRASGHNVAQHLPSVAEKVYHAKLPGWGPLHAACVK